MIQRGSSLPAEERPPDRIREAPKPAQEVSRKRRTRIIAAAIVAAIVIVAIVVAQHHSATE